VREVLRLIGLAVVFVVAALAWFVLAGIMSARTSEQQGQLYGAVADLWGQPLEQQAPTVQFEWQQDVVTTENVLADNGNVLVRDGAAVQREKHHWELRTRDEALASTAIDASMHLDQRRKGLMWFSLYDVGFDGRWTTVHAGSESGAMIVNFPFPVANGMYDDFVFEVNGVNVADSLQPNGSGVRYTVPVKPGDTVAFRVAYKSRGLDQFAYRPTAGVAGQLRDFTMSMTTDFADIDYPAFTMSPSTRAVEGDGWKLTWAFSRVVTSNGMGMVVPQRIQPGPLAAEMAVSAPISLGLFMLWVYVLGLIRGIEIHPVNHLFVAGAFFAFHLLFSYSVDHLPVEAAFGVSAVVSVLLVVSYLRLVVGPQFAWREAGIAQVVYLIGFSLAHFWDGFTGLTVTILGIATLFALMQLTGKVRWAEVFAGSPRQAPVAG
jgi:hypothetical protein